MHDLEWSQNMNDILEAFSKIKKNIKRKKLKNRSSRRVSSRCIQSIKKRTLKKSTHFSLNRGPYTNISMKIVQINVTNKDPRRIYEMIQQVWIFGELCDFPLSCYDGLPYFKTDRKQFDNTNFNHWNSVSNDTKTPTNER